MRSFAACGLFSFLLGCAASPYWYPDDSQHGTVRQVSVIGHDALQVIRPLQPGTKRLGLWAQAEGIILISDSLNEQERACIESHERRHAAGWNHADGALYKANCGDDQ